MKNPFNPAFLFVLLGCILASCNAGPANDSVVYQALDTKEKLKFNQDLIQGQRLYTTHCSNCHQQNGEGLGKLFPPLAQADYLLENPEKVICGIKNGIIGEVVVNGTSYNQPMPANTQLTDLEIAQIMTYIGNSWGNEMGLFRTAEVRKALDGCN
jgi:mono/diheme cytochrome c family protein